MSFCCVLEGGIAYQSLLYHCHSLVFLFPFDLSVCFLYFLFQHFHFLFVIFSKKKVELLIFISNHLHYYKVYASFQALYILFVIQLITQVMTQTFWQGWISSG